MPRQWTGMACAAAVAASTIASLARGQVVDVDRARTLVVGTPAAGARSDAIGATRSGLCRTRLPSSSVHVVWDTPLGTGVDDGPLVDGRGTTYVVGSRGDVVAVSSSGELLWRLATGQGRPGPATLLSEDTLVFADASGNVVAVRDGTLRWRTTLTKSDGPPPAPLALDDGGVVIATEHDLVTLDASGHERSRVGLPEPVKLPLLASLGKVVAVSPDGTVWAWAPGTPEVERIADLESRIDAPAAMTDDRTLVAISGDGSRLFAVDFVRREAVVRAAATGAAMWLGPPVVRDGTTSFAALEPTKEEILSIDRRGSDAGHAWIAPYSGGDGGAGIHWTRVPSLIDCDGTMAIVTADGLLAVTRTAPSASVERIAICPSPAGSSAAASAVAGMAPLDRDSLVVVCRSGTLVALSGAEK